MASREVSVKVTDLPRFKEAVGLMTDEIEALRAVVRELGWREPKDRPWMHHSPADEAFERAFGVESHG